MNNPILTTFAAICSLCFSLNAQDTADSLDLSLLFDRNKESVGGIVSQLIMRSGGFSENDLILVLINEHHVRGRVLSFRYKASGATKGGLNALTQYTPHDVTRDIDDSHLRFYKSVDSETVNVLMKQAYELLINSRGESQFKNFLKSPPGINECYFLLCTSNFTESGERKFIGGYLANPQQGTKSGLFLENVIGLENKWIEELKKPTLDSSIKFTRLHTK
jgi:hypothetical protein